MGEMSNEARHLSAGIDLSQFYQVFFEEAGENLESMEQMLLEPGHRTPPTTKSSTPSSAARTRSRAARPPSASPTWPS
jgi:chemotaxis protein histidine kinase CheA